MRVSGCGRAIVWMRCGDLDTVVDVRVAFRLEGKRTHEGVALHLHHRAIGGVPLLQGGVLGAIVLQADVPIGTEATEEEGEGGREVTEESSQMNAGTCEKD